MMSNDNQISRETKLFNFIGLEAEGSRFSTIMNKMFQENSDDAMMIPMNIHKDDLYFTLSSMKKSEVNGAVISSEFVRDVVEILDNTSGMVKRSGMCDILYSEGETLRGDIFSVRVLTEHLKDMMVSKIAIIGVNHYAKAFSFLACGFNVSYFNDNLEELVAFTQEVEVINADINIITSEMQVDFSEYDAVLDFSNMSSLNMIEKLPRLSMDMKNSKQFSALKEQAQKLDSEYVSYDDIVEKLTAQAYRVIKKK